MEDPLDCIILKFLHLHDAFLYGLLMAIQTLQEHKDRCTVFEYGADERFVYVHLYGWRPYPACECPFDQSERRLGLIIPDLAGFYACAA